MGEPHADGSYPLPGQLPGDADRRRRKEFHLMPVKMTADADIAERDARVSIVPELEGDTFVDDRAVSRRMLKRVTQRVRRCRDIVKQSHLAELARPCEMISKKIVLKGV